MNWHKKWGSILLSSVLLLTPLSAVQAKEQGSAVRIMQAEDTVQGGIPEQPNTGSGDPGAGPEQPGSDSGAPGTAPGNPGSDSNNPGTEPEQPPVNTDDPAVDPEQPGTGEKDPAKDAGNPKEEAQKPVDPAAEKQSELRNLAAGLPYEWSEGPEASHPDDGYKLTDGKYGGLDITDPAWVGHLHKKTREVIFDLGEEKSIASVKAHFLKDYPANSILNPLTVSMYVSDDKQNWGLLAHKATEVLWGDEPINQETYEWDGSKDGIKSGNSDAKMAYARYVKVTFTMHPTQWTFIDEIEIRGTDGQADGAVTVPAEHPQFLAPGEATAGIRNLGLLYNGVYANGLGDWSKERIIPNISYVDKDGNPKDWLFDGVLYLGLNSPQGHDYGLGETNLDEWNWYLDKTFKADGDMQHLNEATKEVAEKLGQPDQKEKVVLMVPNPGESIRNFGNIDGENLSFNAADGGEEKAFANRVKAIQWWLNEVEKRWGEADYSNLELVGIYWLDEQISTSKSGPNLLKETSNAIHAKNLKFFWIPHFMGYKVFMWKDVGFDAVAFQPNYFFEAMDYDRLEDAANLAKQYNISNEVEFDDRMLTDGVFRERYIDYLNSGVESGLMQNGFRAYYQGNNAVFNAAVNKDPSTRVLYDWLYQYVKGEYKINNEAPPEVAVQINGQALQSGAVVNETQPLQFTWELKNDDGLTKVTAQFDGKPYTAGSTIDLIGKPGKHELLITVTAGKSQKTSYIIDAAANADSMKALINRFVEQKEFTTAEGPRSLNNYLEMMKRYEGTDAVQTDKYLRGFNAKLDLLQKDGVMKEKAYSSLKEDVYYLIGNLAQNKKAEASSVEGGSPNLQPGKAVDGFPATRWASDYADNSWFQVDLGEAKEIDTIRIDWEYARAKTYKLLVSEDKQNWTSAVKDHDGMITARDGKETVHFEPVKARYVKFQGIERNTDYGYSFYEFGVYNLSGAQEAAPIDGVKAAVDASAKKVTIDGLVMNGDLAQVNLKVLDPKGKVQYEGQTTGTAAGSFQFAFSLIGEEGTYEALLSLDGMSEPVKVTFEYKKSPGGGDGGNNGGNPGSGGNNGGDNGGSGGGSSNGSGNGNTSGSSTPNPVANAFQSQPDGSVKAVVNGKLDADGKTAVAAVNEQEMQKAMTQAKAGQDGKVKVAIEVKNTGAADYAVDLPAALMSGYPNLQVELITSKASVMLSGQMLAASAQSGKQLRFAIREVGSKSLGQADQEIVGSRPVLKLEVLVDGKAIAWKNEKAPITVSIAYVKANNEAAANIGVLAVNEQDVSTAVTGAAYSAPGQFIRFQTDHTGVYAIFYKQPEATFIDLDGYAWAKDAVERLAASGIVKGTSADTFDPADQVSRADYIVMLVRALDLKADASEAFEDVKPEDYFYVAVTTAKKLGIVTGLDDKRFDPTAKVTRQDMMVMADRALQAAKAKEIAGALSALNGFKDAGKVSAYAAGSIAGMVEHGLIQGSEKMIRPFGNATRAETAVFVDRLLNFLSK
ncbi:DUF4855 domain-containing protein [Paenibacillus donghaensis]|uniref:DUF4855 domain-containing protein n=1 Tax=Paenibacillus donghaensis TaxID=414771 RepID=UPI00188466C4|nr:DUF4855 domain-containing protein [Paenibacillus donghaensis]MBE9916387.1 DUF4855 domain-containing protein [Paenibacillus donghaensis]